MIRISTNLSLNITRFNTPHENIYQCISYLRVDLEGSIAFYVISFNRDLSSNALTVLPKRLFANYTFLDMLYVLQLYCRYLYFHYILTLAFCHAGLAKCVFLKSYLLVRNSDNVSRKISRHNLANQRLCDADMFAIVRRASDYLETFSYGYMNFRTKKSVSLKH